VVWPQNHSDGFSSVWASKPVVTISGGLASKPAATVLSGLASKPVATVFSSLTSKLVATVSPSLALKPAVSFLVEHQNQGGGGFSGLGLKTGSYSLMIWASKLPRQILGLCLKTKWATVCWLRHKIDERATTWDTRRDIAACFTWKQVGLGFSSLASRLAEARRWIVHMAPSQRLRRVQVENGRVEATGYVGPRYTYFAVFLVLCHKSIVVF
jgi:hypothetical protein